MRRVLVALVLLSCGPKAAPVTAVCRLPAAKPGKARPLSPEQWFNLMVDRGLDGEPADCTGTSVKWREPRHCEEPPEVAAPLPVRKFAEDDLVITRVGPTRRLVWVVTQHFDSGEGLGPVALVTEGKDGVDVLAVGTLKARPRRAELRVHEVDGQTFVSAEGESCRKDLEQPTCTRSTVILRRNEDRLEPVQLVDRRGACISAGELFLTRRHELDLGTGWRRRFELNNTVSFGSRRIVASEQVMVSDYDPKKTDLPPRAVRRADAERTISVVKGKLVVDNSSLWTRVRAAEQEP
jgi:hypothetical protein